MNRAPFRRMTSFCLVATATGLCVWLIPPARGQQEGGTSPSVSAPWRLLDGVSIDPVRDAGLRSAASVATTVAETLAPMVSSAPPKALTPPAKVTTAPVVTSPVVTPPIPAVQPEPPAPAQILPAVVTAEAPAPDPESAVDPLQLALAEVPDTDLRPPAGMLRPKPRPITVSATADAAPEPVAAPLPTNISAPPSQPSEESARPPVSALSVDGGRLVLAPGQGDFVRLPRALGTLYLSNPTVAQLDVQTSQRLYLLGRTIGETQLEVLDDNGRQIYTATIEVAPDSKLLTRAAQRAIRGGSISVSTVGGAIFLNGQVKSASDATIAEEVIAGLAGDATMIVNLLQLAPQPQVSLQVRIAEVSRSVSEDLGIRINASGGNGRRSIAAPASPIGDPYTIGLSSGSRNINQVLDALARSGLVTILSEPNLTARSGETASFLAGGRIPYIYGGNDDPSLQMEPIGVELEFTPTVHDSGQIQIALKTQVRDVDSANTSTSDAPALTERSTSTTIELRSGESFAIAGMFQSGTRQSMQGLPGLSKLPVLGALFRSSRFNRGETELLIIVTPYLVTPGITPELPVNNLEPVGGVLEQALSGQFTRPVKTTGSGKSRVNAGGFMLQ